MLKQQFIIIAIIFFSITVYGQEKISVQKKTYNTQKIIENRTPVIDGKLNDVIWKGENWSTDFIQREPNENIAPTEQTAFKIAYDSKYLYIGFKCFDSETDKIVNRMSRRDGFDGDYVEVIIDSYHDLRSAFSLTITSASVKGDKIISLNGMNEDATWNPIWYAESDANEEGWTAEMKIPLSQLRFGKSKNQVWGLQVIRKFFRNDETSVWQRIPIDASGWVSEFGELHGLQNIKPQKQFEIQPFVVTSLETFKKEPNNPYRNSNKATINAGVDGKLGITNDLTLDFTVNPDFGQVEADPAAISLDGFQLFFEEQRPFFVENKNIFNYQFSNPVYGGPFSSDNLFYSRRIGRTPQRTAQINDGEYVKIPEKTTILGAVKFSGKTKKGLSIGVMESVTASEYAEINNNGNTREQLVEPLTNYFVGRVQQDFNNKNTFIGGIVTSTIRDIDDNVNFLHKSAFSAGLDVLHQWKDRSWYAGANLVMSQVKGSKEAILNTQTAITHLFQREDASYVKVNPNKTSLTGTGGDLKFGKAGDGHMKFETGVTWRSPELELNDIGFMRQADEIQNYAGITYSSLKPFGVFRKAAIEYKHWLVWDFGGKLNYIDWDVEFKGTFNNNWKAVFGGFSQPHIYSKSILQGGPRMYLPDQYGAWWAISTDHRKNIYFDLDGWTRTGNSESTFLFSSGVTMTYQPLNQFNISLSPRYTTVRHRIQFNELAQYDSDQRYIMSRLDQETFSFAIRLNYTVNPNLTIQYYGQPFISTGKYKNFGNVVNPLAESQNEQLAFYNQNQISLDEDTNQFNVDENEDAITDYTFNNPDFSFAQFKSNLVIRYEYRPGSEIFLVWSQGLSDYSTPRNSLSENFKEQIFKNQLENTFLIKATYRFF